MITRIKRNNSIQFYLIQDEIDKLENNKLSTIINYLCAKFIQEDFIHNKKYINIDDWIIMLELLTFNIIGKVNKQITKTVLIEGSSYALVELNKFAQNKWVNDLTQIEFESYYPTILNMLNKKLKCNYNYTDFPVVYDTILQYYINNPSSNIKVWLNMAYGMLSGGCTNIKCTTDICKKITFFGRKILSDLQNEFNSNVIYVDTDMLFISHYDEISERLCLSLDKLNLKYKTNTNLSGIFLGKKKYIINNNNNNIIQTHGIRQLN